jgi:hypothetical protein
MDINKTCKLFLKDVYLYDITDCHYTILDQLGFDLSKIDKNDKLLRNTQIGLLMKDNPRLTTVLRTTTISIINEYIKRNNIKPEELILNAYDGIITTRRLTETTTAYIPIDMQNYYEYMLISFDRQKYLAKTYDKTYIKGVSHRYPEMDTMIKRLLNLNFASKIAIFKGLQDIKDEILSSDEIKLYCIPIGEKEYSIFFKGYGETQISKNMIKVLDAADVDREKYFELYLRSFCESIVLEHV